MTEFASAVLEVLRSFASKFILIMNDESTIDFSQWSKRPTIIFTTTQFASSIENLSKNFKIFLLDNGNKNIEQQRFGTIDDLICRLADEIIENYRLEANEYTEAGDIIKAKEQNEYAHRIYRELRQIDDKLRINQSPMKILDITPILIWLISNTRNTEEDTDYIEENLGKYFSSYLIFFNEHDFHDCIAKSTNDMFLIIYSDYRESIAKGSRQFSNVKYVYRYGESKTEDDKIITNRDNLRYHLIYNLIDYYGKLGEQYRANNQKKQARDMFLKAQTLCQLLSTNFFM
jgi:hypothetical protein